MIVMPIEPIPNEPLMLEVLDEIDEDPSRWDQTVYRDVEHGCLTKFCVAGWTCELAAGRWIGNGHLLYAEEDDHPGDVVMTTIHATDETVAAVETQRRAQRLLGLDDRQATLIFHNVHTDPKKLRALVQRVTGIRAVR